MVFVVGVGGVIRELLACGSRFMLLLSPLFFVAADFAIFGGVSRLGPAWKLPLLPNFPLGLPFSSRNWEFS